MNMLLKVLSSWEERRADATDADVSRLAPSLIHAHYLYLVWWNASVNLWLVGLFVLAAIQCIVGVILVCTGVCLLANYRQNLAVDPLAGWVSAGAGAFLSAGAVTTFWLGGRGLQRAGRLARRLVATTNLELTRWAVAQSGRGPSDPPGTVRVNAGGPRLRDPDGRTWEGDGGFADGDVVDRATIEIKHARFADIYRTEHWGMTRFERQIPNGSYTTRLHFAETDPNVTAPGIRVFEVNVQGAILANVDVFVDAGGARRALVREIPVTVATGRITILFTPRTAMHPFINAIEVVPR